MATSPHAGAPADPSILVDVDALLGAYRDVDPDPTDPAQAIAFGTSGHRGSSLAGSFNEAHVLAMAEATCRYREAEGIAGPLFLGADTHALSEPARRSALEVLTARGIDVRVDAAGSATPTPVVSHAILTHNAGAGERADGIVITPSHNPPEDGGFKYNPPHGGPAGTDVTGWIEEEANRILASGLEGVPRRPVDDALAAAVPHDYIAAYVGDLGGVVDLDAIRSAGLRLGADPLGGATVDYWSAIAERCELDIEVVGGGVDPQFGFMRRDYDGKLRMDCSSPYAMGGLVELADRYDVAFGNDPDGDRHGIVTPGGLMNPNHYLAVAVDYLFGGARSWPESTAIGKTLVSSAMLDRVAEALGRRLLEVPVGFKWFVPGLLDGSLGFGGEESAGGSFLRRDGGVWSTDKDGMILCLLAAEITAVTGENPAERYQGLTDRFGAPVYTRVDAPASREQKARLGALSPEQVTADALAGEPITEILTRAPGNDAPIGGLKVVTAGGWFAARPSGTEDVYKIYAESFHDAAHLDRILEEARGVVDAALAG
ncbi:MAG: phosphoglucomutase (alpha-D-glucose-1,6-bisphosphate-dependent) [Actinomycetota bacterium]